MIIGVGRDSVKERPGSVKMPSGKTMKKVQVSKPAARAIALRAQLLDGHTRLQPGKQGVLATIDQLGYVQIDTIAAVKRSHHHTLWTRHRDYSEDQLHELQTQDRRIFEYWGHAMSYLPMSDYRFFLPRMRNFRNPAHAWISCRLEGCRHLLEPVLERIRQEGPLSAKHFSASEDAKRGTWWDWKPAKFALEYLFWRGDLMISERRNFQKVYDLTERVLPADVDLTMPAEEEVARFLVGRAVKACGVLRQKDIQAFMQPVGGRDSDWQAADSRVIDYAVAELVEAREILPVTVEGGDHVIWYALRESVENQPDVQRTTGRVSLLSPFDNLVIRRDWLSKLFGFDYTLECYLPEKKRQYGYFVFPILWGDVLVGRLDPKADRQTKTLIVRNLVLEPWFQASEEFLTELKETLAAFARFNGCRKYVIKNRGWSRAPRVLRKS